MKLNYKYRYIITLIVIGFSYLAHGQSNDHLARVPMHSLPPTTQTLLVFGDSLSAAYNIKREQGWVSLLQDFSANKDFKLNIINASISGETTGGGAIRLEKQLAQHQPDIVIIELGGNDGLRGLDLAETRRNLKKMIELSLEYETQILLAEIKIPPNYGRTYTKRFIKIYAELAELYPVKLIPFFLEELATDPSLMQSDGIHPNANAQPLIVDKLWPYIEPLLIQNSQ